jgi:hypothetical protein
MYDTGADPKEKKTYGEFEREYNVMLNKDLGESRVVTRGTFMANSEKHGYIGVHHDERREWLITNGYDVTRKNMVDADLPTKQIS